MSATATGIGITRLGQIAVNAKDVERATAFYQDKLGLKVLFKAPPGLSNHNVTLSCPLCRSSITVAPDVVSDCIDHTPASCTSSE